LNVAAPAVQAGSKKAKVEFSYRMAPDEPDKKVAESKVYLRPNTEHALELFVKNVETDKEEDALKDVVVRLIRLDGKVETLLAVAKLEKVDKLLPGDKARLVFVPEKA